VALLIGVMTLVVRAAWVGDDAYITFRTVDNLVRGHGPVWNTHERVQAYTNPLWMVMLSAVYGLTKEAFYTSIVVQLLLSAATLWVVATRVARSVGAAAVGLLLCALSKAFIDYSTSGLENPVLHLVLAAFVVVHFGPGNGNRKLLQLGLLASLAYLARPDALLLVLPALGARVVPLWREHGAKALRTNGTRALLLGLSPLAAWLLFSLFYYGFPLPNTAYAKLGAGLPLAFKVKAGLFYLLNSLWIDPATPYIIAAGLLVAFAGRGRAGARSTAVGIVVYLGYVVWIGGDFMAGRFLSAPLLLAVALVLRSRPRQLPLQVGIAAVALLTAWSVDFPSFRSEYERRVAVSDANGITDARSESKGLRLLDATRFASLPQHRWEREGKALKRKPARGLVRGGVGLLGYFAGPEVRIIDHFALADPLLARLPIPDAEHEVAFRAGHLKRAIPKGYPETVASGNNQIEDPGLHAYYDELHLATSGPLWSFARIAAVFRLSFGARDHLLADYLAYQDIKKVTAAQLARGGDKDRWQEYTHFQLGLKDGVLFTEHGVLVTVGKPADASVLTAQLSPGTFRIAFLRGRQHLAEVDSRGGSPGDDLSQHELAIPATAVESAFDGVLVLPLSPARDHYHVLKKLGFR
jgi:arabinofuranosyltransferase